VHRRFEDDPAPSADAVELALPFSGRWLVQNSPADRVPSHGTRLFATSYAIDFVPVDQRGRSAPVTVRTLVRPEAPELFRGFGRPITAPIDGVIVGVHDGESDHTAFRGIPSLFYALTQPRRVARGWEALAGNHVLVEAGPRVVVALCHLRRGSIGVSVGQTVRRGDVLGECGNSGNSTEPHVHLQAMDGADPSTARPVPIAFTGRIPANGTIVTGADAAGQP
jgi:murein DD-endopeptidase MepM/ murein hydrolase activator NlpD